MTTQTIVLNSLLGKRKPSNLARQGNIHTHSTSTARAGLEPRHLARPWSQNTEATCFFLFPATCTLSSCLPSVISLVISFSSSHISYPSPCSSFFCFSFFYFCSYYKAPRLLIYLYFFSLFFCLHILITFTAWPQETLTEGQKCVCDRSRNSG